MEIFEDVPEIFIESKSLTSETLFEKRFQNIYYNIGSIILLLIFFGSIKVTNDVRKKNLKGMCTVLGKDNLTRIFANFRIRLMLIVLIQIFF